MFLYLWLESNFIFFTLAPKIQNSNGFIYQKFA